MKTAISIPEPLFERAEALAHQLGISRSELYATALAVYIEAHEDEHITEQLNRFYEVEDSSLDEVLAKMQYLSLPKEEW
jgi:metal-responsive CopG/Arc/MetJ family transcriptional regulator